MRDLFRQHHKLSNAERSTLWDNATFALDANVLLNIYRYADSTREDLLRVFAGLRGRVWVPFQAASEFYRNRLDVIQEQQRRYAELESTLDQTLTALHAGSLRKSAFLRIAEIEAILRPAVEQARKLVAEQQAQHPDLVANDEYLDRLVEVIDTSVGAEPEASTYETLCGEAQTRIDKQQPQAIAMPRSRHLTGTVMSSSGLSS